MRIVLSRRTLNHQKSERPPAPGRAYRPSAERLEGRALLAVAIAEVPLPAGADSSGYPSQDITQGPDGNVWFTEGVHKLGRITPSGGITEYPIASTGALGELTAGPDGNMWVVDNSQVILLPGVLRLDSNGNPVLPPGTSTVPHATTIDRVTPDGVVTEFPLPEAHRYDPISSITAGPDGNLWFTVGSEVGRITPSGQITAFALPSGTSAQEIIPGPDGNLWFTSGNNQVGRITTDGAVTMLPTVLAGSVQFHDGFVLGPDGNFWVAVTEFLPGGARGVLDRVSLDGAVTPFPLSGLDPRAQGVSTNGGILQGLATGADGRLWLTQGTDQIVRFALDGSTTAYTTPTPGALVSAITAGPEGNLWFLESWVNRIGQIVLNAPEPATIAASGPASIGTMEGLGFSGQVASFSPVKPGDTAADYVARIDWGDGASSLGSIVSNGQQGFLVDGTHNYGEDGHFSATVTILDVQLGDPGATATVTVPAVITEPPLTPIPVDTTYYRGELRPILVARASTPDRDSLQGDGNQATIDWGDGSTSQGILQSDLIPARVFVASSVVPAPLDSELSVYGSHVYAAAGDYTVRTTLTDDSGQSVVITSTVHYLTPTINWTHGQTLTIPEGPQWPASGLVYPWFVGQFRTNGVNVPPDSYTAVINWGDGSRNDRALVGVDATGTYFISAPRHAFPKVGTYTFHLAVSGYGQTVVIPGTARVVVPQPAYAGLLSMASDTGYSSVDGITAQTRPVFQGAAPAGTTVELFANASVTSPLTLIPLGHTVSGPDGRWTIASATLAEGTYRITANERMADGTTRSGLPVRTGRPGDPLVIDTTGPRVSSAIFDPATSRITLTFQDDRSQVDPLRLIRSGSVRFSQVLPSGAHALPVRVQSIRSGGGGVVLKLGHPVPDGRYVLQVAAESVRDAAGNALDGEFRATLPSGDGQPGGNFLGQFLSRGNAPTAVKPIVAGPQERVSPSSAASDSRRTS